jgi:hypothetical protein
VKAGRSVGPTANTVPGPGTLLITDTLGITVPELLGRHPPGSPEAAFAQMMYLNVRRVDQLHADLVRTATGVVEDLAALIDGGKAPTGEILRERGVRIDLLAVRVRDSIAVLDEQLTVYTGNLQRAEPAASPSSAPVQPALPANDRSPTRKPR